MSAILTPEKIKVADLHPTQMTVGMREVTDKQKELAKEPRDKRHEYLQRHPIPLVLGPGEKLFLIDHHHLARALWDDDFEHAWAQVVADLSKLEQLDCGRADVDADQRRRFRCEQAHTFPLSHALLRAKDAPLH